MKILTNLPVLAAVPFGIFFLNFVISNTQLNDLASAYTPKEWGFEQKITVLVNVAAVISTFLMSIILFVGSIRFLGYTNPFLNKDPEVILFANRVLQNSIEQTMVFLPILAAWTLNKSIEANKNDVLIFAFIWMAGRILFVVGYAVKFLVDGLTTFRAFGFLLNQAATIILISRLVGVPII